MYEGQNLPSDAEGRVGLEVTDNYMYGEENIIVLSDFGFDCAAAQTVDGE